MSKLSDSDLKGWFCRRGLPWCKDKQKFLDELGVKYVEDLKVIEPKKFYGIFKAEKYGKIPTYQSRYNKRY